MTKTTDTYTIRKTEKGYLVRYKGNPIHIFVTRKLAKAYLEKLKG